MIAFLEKLKGNTETPQQTIVQERAQDIFVERTPINPGIKLFYAVTKNIKLLIRSKISALIFIFGPLLIITLVALAFNTSTLFDLNIATYSESYSTLSHSIITNLSDKQYNVIEMDSEEKCVDAVKSGDFQVCAVFPPNMLLDNSANNVVKIYVDNSRLNIANLVASQISTKVSVEASALSSEIVTEILTVLDTTNTKTIQTKTLLEQGLSKNQDAKGSLEAVSSNVGSIDLSYENLDTTALNTEIKSLQTNYNLTDATFANLNTLIDSIEIQYGNLGAKLDTSKDSLGTIKTNTESIAATLEYEGTTLQEAHTKLESIIADIETIKITNVVNIVSPVKTSIEPISSVNSYLLYILPTMLVLLIMLVALLMSSGSIVMEKESRAYFRNFITPTNEFLFMTAEFLSNALVISFQIVILLGVLYYFFSETFPWQTFLLVGLALLLIGSFFILLGMLFGYLFNTKQTVTLAAISAAMIMLFFSNAILPLETLSSYTRDIVQYNPFIIGETMLKKILLFEAAYPSLLQSFYLLLGFSAAVLIGAILARTFSKKYLNTG